MRGPSDASTTGATSVNSPTMAVGTFGALYTRSDAGWALEDLGFTVGQNFHGSWIDDRGGLWAVGGQTFSPPYNEGLLIHRGAPVASEGL